MIGRNNPFNIRYNGTSKWQGLNESDPSTRGFCNFISLDYGVRAALYLLIYSYRKKGIATIEQIIKRFAPITENDTEAYIKFVERKVWINRNDVLSNIFEYCMVLFAMSIFEGNRIEFTEIYYIYCKFKKLDNLKIYHYGQT